MQISEETKNGVAVFKLEGRLDSNTSPALEERILRVIEDGTNRMVVDFTQLDYISSAGLRVLNLATKKLRHADGRLVICSLQDYVREVFEIAGFDTFIPIAADLNEALAGL